MNQEHQRKRENQKISLQTRLEAEQSFNDKRDQKDFQRCVEQMKAQAEIDLQIEKDIIIKEFE